MTERLEYFKVQFGAQSAAAEFGGAEHRVEAGLSRSHPRSPTGVHYLIGKAPVLAPVQPRVVQSRLDGLLNFRDFSVDKGKQRVTQLFGAQIGGADDFIHCDSHLISLPLKPRSGP